MLTKADDYPIHQTPDPIAVSTNRNCYDRYFFNGHSVDGGLFFGAALGVYPHLDVMDSAFSVAIDGVQHNLRGSRRLGWERMDTKVGPLSVEVIEPLMKLRVLVSPNEQTLASNSGARLPERHSSVREPVAVFHEREAPSWVVERGIDRDPAFPLIKAPSACLTGGDKQSQLCEAGRARCVEGGAMEVARYPDAPIIAADDEV